MTTQEPLRCAGIYTSDLERTLLSSALGIAVCRAELDLSSDRPFTRFYGEDDRPIVVSPDQSHYCLHLLTEFRAHQTGFRSTYYPYRDPDSPISRLYLASPEELSPDLRSRSSSECSVDSAEFEAPAPPA